MTFKNFRLNRIQNGRLSATIYFHIADICEISAEDASWKILT